MMRSMLVAAAMFAAPSAVDACDVQLFSYSPAAVVAAPVVQTYSVPLVQQVYAAPVVQYAAPVVVRQSFVQSYAAPIVQRQRIVQRSKVVARPLVRRQVIRERLVIR